MDIKRYYDFLNQKRSEMRAISTKKLSVDVTKTKVEQFTEVINFDEFKAFCVKWHKKANVYVGIHERIPSGTKAKDVNCVKIIAIDVDATHPVNEAATDKELDICKTETFDMVEELAEKYARPSIIMTGNGYQLLWKIRPITINDSNRDGTEKKIQKFITKIKKKYNSDNKTIDQIGDLARILKVAGTWSVKGNNTKERPYRKSFFVEFNDNISDILRDEILTTEVELEQTIERKEAKPSQLGKFDYLLLKDPKLSTLYNGNVTGYKSRSEAEMALVCKLVYYDFMDSEIDLILRNCGIGKWPSATKAYKDLTLSKARLKVIEKKNTLKDITLEDVYTTLSKWLYLKDFNMVDLMLAIIVSQRLDGSPLWMIFVGASGDGKTEMAKMIENLECIYKADQITPNTFVSGNPKVDDLAPLLNNKVLLISDFASILSYNSDAQRTIFAQMRNLYDGDAYKDTGAGARKHYSGLRITLIANSTPVIDHKILIHQDLGTRELMYRTDYNETEDDFRNKTLKALDNEFKKKEMRQEIQGVVSAFLDNVPEPEKDLSDELIQWFLEKARWLSIMRSNVQIDSYTGELLGKVVPEVPTRLIMQLKVMYICLKALDKNYTDKRAKEIILRVINSSAKEIRVRIYEHLQSSDEEITSSKIAEAMRVGKKTVIKECNILWNLKLINCRKDMTIQFGRESEISYWSRLDEKLIEESVD